MTYWASTKEIVAKESYVTQIFNDLPKKLREFTIYFPAYNDLAQFEIGVPAESKLATPSAYRLPKPVVFYGTSVTQGGCSSRTATGFVSVVGRQLGINVVNLGFSGNGFCDPELIPLLNEIDMACLVMDPVANMGVDRMKTGFAPFIDGIRTQHPKLPIVIMTTFLFAQENFFISRRWQEASDIAVETYRQMRRRGDKNVHLIECRKFFGAGPDHPSVDGVHLTDLGFAKMADGVTPVLKKVLKLT
jgi:lysophospholipase L1-like esterase